jgi:hypothetical protein
VEQYAVPPRDDPLAPRSKLFLRTAEDFADLRPLYRQFDALRRECDRKGIFRNAIVDRVFGVPEG